jgi:hypothetical protein
MKRNEISPWFSLAANDVENDLGGSAALVVGSERLHDLHAHSEERLLRQGAIDFELRGAGGSRGELLSCPDTVLDVLQSKVNDLIN